jgi:hypothetical protein
LDSRLFAQSSNNVIDVDKGPLDNVAHVRDADAAPLTDVVVKLNCFTSSPFEEFSPATEEGFTEVSLSHAGSRAGLRKIARIATRSSAERATGTPRAAPNRAVSLYSP